MKSLAEHRWFEHLDWRGFFNFPPEVERLARARAVREGLCLVNAMHIPRPHP